jgi:MipA family protein
MLKSLTALALVFGASCAWAQDDGFKGDLGGMAFQSSAMVAGTPSQSSVLPYVYGDWGRFYGRVDTFGVRTVPFGHGHLELAVRVGTEGVEGRKTAYPSLSDRSSPMPVGLGTFQETPWGGLFAYLMHDPRSGGQFSELTWVGEFQSGSATFYPQLAVQYRSAAYVNHLYGVSAAESAGAGLPTYQADRSVVPIAALHMTLPLSGPWALQAQLRYRWLDRAISNSPLVNTHSQTSGLLALTRTFN